MPRCGTTTLVATVLITLVIGASASSVTAQHQPPIDKKNDPKLLPGTTQESTEDKLIGRVVLASDPNQGIANTRVFGYPVDLHKKRWFLSTKTDSNGRFKGKPVTTSAVVGAFNKDHTLAAIQRVEIGQPDVVLPLAPSAIIYGTMSDEESGKPAANRKVEASMRFHPDDRHSVSFFAREGMTDNTGRFQINGLIPGFEYKLFAETADNGKGKVSRLSVGRTKPKSAEEIDLGELRIPKPYRTPTFQEYITSNYIKKTPYERLKRGLTLANLGFVRLLVIAAEPDSDAALQFFKLRYDYTYDRKNRNYAKTHKLLHQFIPLSLAPSGAEEFLAEHAIAFPAKDDATFTVFDADGSLVGQIAFSELRTEGKLDLELLAEFLALHRHPPLPNARQVLKAALAQAVRQDKHVLVQISSSGCGPCYLLSEYLENHKELMQKDYVLLKLDPRMQEFTEVYEILSEGKSRGVPWMLILDSSGTTLITGDTEKGNIGYPSNPAGVEHFKRMLVSTKQRMSDDDLSTLLLPLQRETERD